tara:strand:+ start:394 stop:753 length:360 start_codon:yes stop_codon:yes gene_type:complete
MESIALEYLRVDKEIKHFNERLKKLREEKIEISSKLIELMSQKDSCVIKLPENEGFICLKNSCSFESINKTYLNESLQDFFEKQKNIKEKTNPDTITQHILENREKKEKQVVKLLKRLS